jgi:cold shock CspA family protein
VSSALGRRPQHSSFETLADFQRGVTAEVAEDRLRRVLPPVGREPCCSEHVTFHMGGQGDVFMHGDNVIPDGGTGRPMLAMGQKVEFELGCNNRNRSRAEDVKVLSE